MGSHSHPDDEGGNAGLGAGLGPGAGRGSAQGRGLAQALTQQAVVGQGLRAREVKEDK